MTSDGYLSPYDTGKRLEPKFWPSSPTRVIAEMAPIAQEMAEDELGKVDFDDENGESLFTIWVERNEAGHRVIHIQELSDVPTALQVHR